MKSEKLISVVITHFNKGDLLIRTLSSLQSDMANILEIIIVDDASDEENWTQTKKEVFLRFEKIIIIENKENLGPAIRLNQGAKITKGSYIFFMDADDIIQKNALNKILKQTMLQNADLCYGLVKKITNLEENISDDVYETSKNPISYIIKNNILHMCILVHKDVFFASKGCNENLFIQDESLALALAITSKKMIYRTTPTVFILNDLKNSTNKLSTDKSQQHHDTFISIYDFLNKNKSINPSLIRILEKKAISNYKKNISKPTVKVFLIYFASKIIPHIIWHHYKEEIKQHFGKLKVRRPKKR